ncbi:MAG: zinc-binding dehydrogenase [Saprospiraceae bacterium]|nr:zinc-binding dehydrogenase [Saprospiraceae bacterium]
MLGSEFAGEIEAIGADVSKFKPGDQVFGYMGMNMGANAEFICMKESGMIGLKPSNFSYYESAACCPAEYRVGNFEKSTNYSRPKSAGKWRFGRDRLYGITIGKALWRGSYRRVQHGKNGLQRLGADVVLDYTKGVVSQSTKQYDLIVDVLGRLKWADAKKLLTENGVLLLGSFKTGKLLLMLWTKLFSKQKVICAFSEEKQDYLKIIKDLAEKKALKVIIDSTFTMEKAADAHAHYERKANNGHVILTIN